MTAQRSNDLQTTENCSLCKGTGWKVENGKATACVCTRERRIASRLPARYYAANLSNFSSETKGTVLSWLECPGDGLLIMGPVGTGKTHLAAAISRHFLETGKDAVFRRWANFYADLREALRANISEGSVLEPLERTKFLIMDDLGAGSLSDHERRSTLELLDRRLNKNRPTIVTTNWSLGKISECIDDRIASRLSTFTKIELSGQDLRLRLAN